MKKISEKFNSRNILKNSKKIFKKSFKKKYIKNISKVFQIYHNSDPKFVCRVRKVLKDLSTIIQLKTVQD
jgi:predicted choloylglycine hydrolase